MVRKGLLLLVLVVFAAGLSFAQPKNTLTVDVGPTIVGIVLGSAANIIGNFVDADEIESSSAGFGLGVQYEMNLTQTLSVALRGAYLGGGIGFATGQGTILPGVSRDAHVDIGFQSISAEGHVRFYPFGLFFVDGMLGYANMGTSFVGDVRVSGYGQNETRPIDFTARRNFLKVGGKLGYKFDFGRPGGFVFEPSVGYYHAIGFGDSVYDQVVDYIGDDRLDMGGFEDVFSMIERFVFVGGPRLSLAFGWRF